MSFSSPLNCHGGFSGAVVCMEGLLPSHFFFSIQTTAIDYSNSKCQEGTCLRSLLGQHSQTQHCWKGPCPVIHGPLLLIEPLVSVNSDPSEHSPKWLGLWLFRALTSSFISYKGNPCFSSWSHCSSMRSYSFLNSKLGQKAEGIREKYIQAWKADLGLAYE